MRELDILLARFLATGIEPMQDADLQRLERLLSEPDQDILAWITGSATPPDADTSRVAAIIRSTIDAD